ncbi:MAG: bifunctional aspartate kinase/diaminopimelate decarboxylase [Gammaproteobacteria bacterium]|nr:bifunctional aspartate kinase/diaminopimelate decarboxylase [Gammaproteobacteria bacterium]
MSTQVGPSWVVLKFGGTSVSNERNWRSIAATCRERLATGARVLVVHSAVTGVTDRLEKLLAAALKGEHAEPLAALRARHHELSDELGLGADDGTARGFAELAQLLDGIALMRECTDRTRARVLAMGELLATEIGARYLRSVGLDASWADARQMLAAEQRRSATERAGFLSATCGFAPDPALRQRLAAATPVVVTQGFIASDADGQTVLLGRGGSDTSAAYLAAKLQASRLEIWTDVPGMFSANPRATPTARQLLTLTYDEAQEIATAGAKVLHPRCILPARQYRIPLYVYATQAPQLGGTLLTALPVSEAAQVKAVCVKKGVTLVSMDSPGMWHQVGFLADAFQVFKDHGMSVDLVSTSETNVTVTLDPQANTLDAQSLAALQRDLGQLCRVQLIGPCASVSLVGRNIRGILHQLGGAFELFEEQKIYLVSQAANDLNFTFVVDESQGDRLVEELHDMLVRPVRADAVLGPTWEQLFGKGAALPAAAPAWWETRRTELLALMQEHDAAYVYDTATVRERCARLKSLQSVSRVLYAIKANANAGLLRVVHAAGLGLECVSRGEAEHALHAVPGLAPDEILFTPNFAPRVEYEWALAAGLRVTVDNAFVLREWPALFAGREIFVRVDPGTGRGHHQHVRTGGKYSKFGVPIEEMDELIRLTEAAGARIVGLHAHVGSGIFDLESWADTGRQLAALLPRLPQVRAIDVGGGLGVPDRAGKPALDLARLDARLAEIRRELGAVELWLEPGRYVVAESGVLLARVTQTKRKGASGYVGIATGMNSLIRPALYGAHHDILNLSRLEEPATEIVDVVGPICETGDFLGHDRLLPPTREGDVLLVATAGAYGAAMASRYNLREPAPELLV